MRIKFMSRLKDFDCSPHIVNNKWNGRDWIIKSDLVFEYKDKVHTIPSGRVTNFGSIPKICRAFLNRMGKSLRSFVVHDETYGVDGVIDVDRREGDEILYQLSLYDDESKTAARSINYGLWMGGRFNFKKEKVKFSKPSKQSLDYTAKCNGYYLKEIEL